MSKVNARNAEYKSNDLLEVEFNLLPNNYVLPLGSGLFTNGKNKIEILGKQMPILLDLLQSEEEQEEIKALNMRNAKRIEKRREELKAEYPEESEETTEVRLFYWLEQGNSVAAEFTKQRISDNDRRDPKPISSVYVLKNKGPKLDDVEAANQKAEIQASQQFDLLKQNSEMMKTFLEFMKQQQEKK